MNKIMKDEAIKIKGDHELVFTDLSRTISKIQPIIKTIIDPTKKKAP